MSKILNSCLFVWIIILLSESTFSSTLVQTQLADVKNVSSSVFVSQYLPKEIISMEATLKQEIDATLQQAGMLSLGDSAGHLSVHISGNMVERKDCGDLYWIQIKVRFSERIILQRSPELKLPNQSFYTWEDEWVNVIEPDRMQNLIKGRVDYSVGLFIEKVQYATSLEKAKPQKQNSQADYLSDSEVQSARKELERLKQALELWVGVKVGLALRGSNFILSYSLKNNASYDVDACLGITSKYFVLGSKSNFVSTSEVVDHPGCEQRFTLKTGEVLTWERTIEMPDVGIGPARLKAFVHVVTPKYCDVGGCYEMSLAAVSSPFQIQDSP